MMVRHDWITLHANGIRYLEKAPLMYWGMALSFRAFGPKDWAARLPLALFALALFLVTYAAGRSLFGSAAAGFYGALILLTSFGFFIYTRIMIPDVIVCLWLSLAMLLFWRSLEEERPSRSTAWDSLWLARSACSPKASLGSSFRWPSWCCFSCSHATSVICGAGIRFRACWSFWRRPCLGISRLECKIRRKATSWAQCPPPAMSMASFGSISSTSSTCVI